MKKAIYTNRATGETYTLCGVNDCRQAWQLFEFVCGRMNWNRAMFHHDVTIKII